MPQGVSAGRPMHPRVGRLRRAATLVPEKWSSPPRSERSAAETEFGLRPPPSSIGGGSVKGAAAGFVVGVLSQKRARKAERDSRVSVKCAAETGGGGGEWSPAWAALPEAAVEELEGGVPVELLVLEKLLGDSDLDLRRS